MLARIRRPMRFQARILAERSDGEWPHWDSLLLNNRFQILQGEPSGANRDSGRSFGDRKRTVACHRFQRSSLRVYCPTLDRMPTIRNSAELAYLPIPSKFRTSFIAVRRAFAVQDNQLCRWWFWGVRRGIPLAWESCSAVSVQHRT